MAVDPTYFDFGMNLVKGHLASQQVAVENAAIAQGNVLAHKQAAEQQGYAALNYNLSLEELNAASLNAQVKALQARGQAVVDSAVNGTNIESADLQIARSIGETETQVSREKHAASVNYRNTQKSIVANEFSAQRLGKPQPSLVGQVLNAGVSTYFDSIKAGLIK